jgi:hypothetical protein
MITDQLTRQFPDLNPKIARLGETEFMYELEKHGNFTYYSVKYRLSHSGSLTIDWENAELTVY